MTDHVAGPDAPASSESVAELHQLCRDDYASAAARRDAQDHRDDVHPFAAPASEGGR